MFMTGQPKMQPLHRCFSTLGCADLELPEICALAGEFRIPGIELRGIGQSMDMPEYCAAQGLRASRLREVCRQYHTRPTVAGSSLKLTSASEADRAQLLALSAWADEWGIPYVRVFGGGAWGRSLTDSDYAQAAEVVKWWRSEQAARDWR